MTAPFVPPARELESALAAPLTAKDLVDWYESNGGLEKMAKDFAETHKLSMKYESALAAARVEIQRLRKALEGIRDQKYSSIEGHVCQARAKAALSPPAPPGPATGGTT